MMSDEDRKARQRAYSRAYRQRKALQRTAAVDAPDGHTAPVSAMQEAVEQSLSAMRWLVPSDGAAVLCARLMAERVDGLSGDRVGFTDWLRALTALMRILRDLGGTPTVRLQYELRSARLQGATENEAVKAAANVTRFPRPPKHDRD